MNKYSSNLPSILIVDDNPKNLQVLGGFLEEEGFPFEFALNGATAFEWVSRKDFDLILLDIMMPQMDGFEVCKILKDNNETREIPVIFLTAINDTESIVRAFDLGAVDYITKPFNRKELLARVNTQIEIKKAKDIIKSNMEEIENKNRQIINSIDYAKHIQSGVISTSQNFSEWLPDSFSFSLPKSIVGGDFIWSTKIRNKLLFGVFDCTGHGVPGAFISLLYYIFLNDTVKFRGISEPHLILDRLRESAIDILGQKGKVKEVHDGMDGSIISYDVENKIIDFAGAFNGIYLVTDGIIQEYKGDRMPVSYQDKMKEFTLQKIPVKKGDVIYFFTDGYQDQFGGTNRKKMGSSKFKEILLSLYQKPMESQKKILLDSFTHWKGEEDQTDDVTVAGIRFR